MNRLLGFLHAAGLVGLLLAAPHAGASQLPINVTVAGKVATIQIGLPASPVGDLTIDFDDVSGLTPASLGVRADTVDPTDPTLLARLPSMTLDSIPAAFAVMVTVEPPNAGGLSFHRQAHLDLHIPTLSYIAGTRLRLFKAPLGGNFRDITSDVAPGSVRTRGTTGGWSQLLVVADTRPTSTLVSDKIAALRPILATLPSNERNPLVRILNQVQAAVNGAQYANAIARLDAFRARVSSRSGTHIPDLWRAQRDLVNTSGELLSGADTLRYSIGYLRDYGN